MPPRSRPDLAAAIAAGDARRREVAAAVAGRHATLPLRYWRQQAHFTTPAADEAMARKAVEGGTAPMARILERFAVTPAQLAERLGIGTRLVEDLLASPERAPLVMLDGEDAQALRDDVTEQGLRSAAAILRDADWGGAGPPTLRFFRPPGFNLETTVHDLYTVLWALAEAAACGDTLVVFESPHRVVATLTDALAALGDRRIAVCRELTKLHEEIWRGSIADAIPHFAQPRGECFAPVPPGERF